MKTIKRDKVCGIEHAGALDLNVRKLFHNPQKILNPYINEGMTVLEIGCGPGFFTPDMAKLVGKTGKVVAADLQEGMLEMLKKKIKGTDLQDRIELYKCPDNKIGLSGEFDFIFLFYVLHEVPDQTSFLQEIYTLLKPGGSVLIVEPKVHVHKKNFNGSIEILKHIGYNIIEKPSVFFSRSVLIEKKS
jgi:ubiquinone/menaquinone biosynthesis C-methylase UbiE